MYKETSASEDLANISILTREDNGHSALKYGLEMVRVDVVAKETSVIFLQTGIAATHMVGRINVMQISS